MKERHLRQLKPATRQALRLASRITGQDVLLRRFDTLPDNARAMLIRPLVPRQPYEIHVRRGEDRVLDHLIAHEVGHLVRLYHVPESERLAAAFTRDTRLRAARQIVEELEQVIDRGLPEFLIGEAFTAWHSAVCTQLANFPADLRIEAWIRETFPGLRAVQHRSLTHEVQRGFSSLLPDVRYLVPKTIYNATISMNAAQAHQVARFYNEPRLLRPYEETGFADTGRRLAELLFAAPDEGHRSDMAMVERWAGELGLSGWVTWESLSGAGRSHAEDSGDQIRPGASF